MKYIVLRINKHFYTSQPLRKHYIANLRDISLCAKPSKFVAKPSLHELHKLPTVARSTSPLQMMHLPFACFVFSNVCDIAMYCACRQPFYPLSVVKLLYILWIFVIDCNFIIKKIQIKTVIKWPYSRKGTKSLVLMIM